MTEEFSSLTAATLLVGGIVVSLATWAVLIVRVKQGETILPYQPRRPVPWRGFDLVIIILAYILLFQPLVMLLMDDLAPPSLKTGAREALERQLKGLEDDEPPADGKAEDEKAEDGNGSQPQAEQEPDPEPPPAERLPEESTPNDAAPAGGPALAADEPAAPEENLHPIQKLLMEDPNPLVIAVCFLAAVIVAPIAEEFFFRLFLQGWLEALEHKYRRHAPVLRRSVRGMYPVAISAFIFGIVHLRVAPPDVDIETFPGRLTADSLARLLAILAALVVVRVGRGATWEDFGLAGGPSLRDLKVGVVTFLAMLAPLYAIQIPLHLLLPPDVAPDPLPLMVYGAIAGFVYYRTHRIVPLIVTHFCFNGFTLATLLAV